MISQFGFSQRLIRLIKEGFWIILGQVMAVTGTLVGVRVLTELLDPDAYGELALGMTVAVLVNQTVLGPLSNGVARFYAPALAQDDLVGYLNAVRQLLVWATGIVILMIVVVAGSLLIAGRPGWIAISFAAFIFSIISGYNSILNGILNASRKRSIVALHQGMDAWARFLVAAGLLMLLGATSPVAMIGYALAGSVVLLSQYIFFRNVIFEWKSDIDRGRGWQNNILKYSWPFATWGIFTWAQLASDRWALGVFSATQDVGLYTALFQLGYYPMSIATGMVVQFLAPIFFQRSVSELDLERNIFVKNMIWRVTWVALGITGASVIVAFLFHTQIFGIFVAKEYASVSYLLPWMILSSGIFSAGQAITLKLMSEMKTQTMITAKIVTAFVGVALNFAGAYIYGIEGIVVSGILFSLLYFFWMVKLASDKEK